MLADRVRVGSSKKDVSVNIQINDTSKYYNPSQKVYIVPIIKGFELTPSDFDTGGRVIYSRLSDIISLYCGDAIALPRHSTINVTTLKSKYFIITKDGYVVTNSILLTNRNVTVELLSYGSFSENIFRLSEDLEDGDIIDVYVRFD